MGWVVDKGLDKLLAQINALAPNRSKASDGSIGDAAHSARESDHNPESPPPAGNPDNQVDARDFTHDPAHGADMGVISEAIRRSRDRRVSYVIWNRRITGPNHGWAWDPYSGSDPHTGHMHVSVNDTHNDETQDWQIGADMPLTKTDAELVATAVWFRDDDPDAKVTEAAWTALHNARVDAAAARKAAELVAARPPVEVDYDRLADALLRRVLTPPTN